MIVDHVTVIIFTLVILSVFHYSPIHGNKLTSSMENIVELVVIREQNTVLIRNIFLMQGHLSRERKVINARLCIQIHWSPTCVLFLGEALPLFSRVIVYPFPAFSCRKLKYLLHQRYRPFFMCIKITYCSFFYRKNGSRHGENETPL